MAERRRVNVRAILADLDLRRKLMVPTIQATQAREGIETSHEQAEHAYYVVTEGEKAAFFALTQFARSTTGADARRTAFEQALRDHVSGVRRDVPRRDFGSVEGSPLAYDRVGLVAPIFREAPALDPAWGMAAQGLATAADERFVRQWWEVSAERIGLERDWVPFAKGGEFSRFYADVHLVVWWQNRGQAIRQFPAAYIRNEDKYFQPGLTWALRTQRGFNMRAMPAGCIFGHKGPAVLPQRESDADYILGVANSAAAEFLLRGLMSFGSWEVGVIKRLPVPQPSPAQHRSISSLAQAIHESKATWDEGNETSTRFREPWILRDDLVDATMSLSARLDRLAEHEAEQEARIQSLYGELNDEVFRLYGFTEESRAAVEDAFGDRPPEVLWSQMEGKSKEQKRSEHVFRLLSYLVKQTVEADQDGIVPFQASAGESSLLTRLHGELSRVFHQVDVGLVEVEIANELKKGVKGYRRASSVGEWLENVFFDYHCSLYRNRPIVWHVASAQGRSPAAFGALVRYHGFDADRLAKLRARYVRDALDMFRREAALAEKAGRSEERLEWLGKAEELSDLDERLRWIQEGRHQGAERGDQDFRILAPWKPVHLRPRGWSPDVDDGVKVNIAPLQKAGVLRRAKVV